MVGNITRTSKIEQPMNTTYIITAIVGILCLLPFAIMAIRHYRLEKFRNSLKDNENILVKVKQNDIVSFKYVLRRLPEGLIRVKNFENDGWDIVSIDKIHPL